MTTYFDPDGITAFSSSIPYSHLMLSAASINDPYYAANRFYPQDYENQPAAASDMGPYGFSDMYGNGDSSEEWSTDGNFVGYALPADNSNNTTGSAPHPGPQHSMEIHKYPDPDTIRNYHTLHSMLPLIQPARLHNSIDGPKLDLVEEHTLHKFAIAVPKKMLVLFCGRKVVNRYLRTLEREDDENWKGGPVRQELRFPVHMTNHIGMKIVVSWMVCACQKDPSEMKSIRIPKNLFAALSLSRALTALGLHRDANRVDATIANHHYKRPMYLNEMVAIWNCLPKDSKYTYRMVEDLRKQRCKYENGDEKALPDGDKVLEFLEQNAELKARVDDPDKNTLPFFGTEWCVRAALRTQQMLATMDGLQDDNTLVDPHVRYMRVNDAKNYSRWSLQPQQDKSHSNRGRDQQNDRPKAKKQPISLSEWQPQAAPTAWPEFEKTVVLKILEANEITPEDIKSTHDRNDSAHSDDDGSPQW